MSRLLTLAAGTALMASSPYWAQVVYNRGYQVFTASPLAQHGSILQNTHSTVKRFPQCKVSRPLANT